MSVPIDLSVEFNSDDWLRTHIWAEDGVLAGYVTLRINGRTVLDLWPCGLNNSAISLARSGVGNHIAADAATELEVEWPLFFCSGGLENDCGIVADFSVAHDRGRIILSDFHRCEVPAGARFVVPWKEWAETMHDFGRSVLKRLPHTKQGVSSRFRGRYRRYRRQLKHDLDALGRRLEGS